MNVTPGEQRMLDHASVQLARATVLISTPPLRPDLQEAEKLLAAARNTIQSILLLHKNDDEQRSQIEYSH